MPVTFHAQLVKNLVLLFLLSLILRVTLFYKGFGPNYDFFLYGLFYFNLFYFLYVAWISEIPFLKGPDKAFTWVCFLFLALTCGTTFYRIELVDFEKFLRMLSLGLNVFVYGFLLSKLFKRTDYESLILFISVAIAFLALLSIGLAFFNVKSLFGISFYFNGVNKQGFELYGLYNNRNRAAHFSQWLPSLAFFYALTGKKTKTRVLWLAIGLVTLIHIVITFSRGGQLGLLISLIPIFIYLKQHHKKLLMVCSLVLVSFLILILYRVDFAKRKYLEDLFSSTDRALYWKECLNFMRQKSGFLVGTGMWGYWPQNTSPHNSYLGHLLYLGVGGLFCFAYFLGNRLFSSIRAELRKQNSFYDRVLLFSILGMMATAFFEDTLIFTFYFPATMFWILVGMLNTNRTCIPSSAC